MTAARHIPVLLAETLGFLEPGPGKRIIDGTFGFGGHAAALLDRGADVLGLDLDEVAMAACRERAAAEPRLHCQRLSFCRFDEAMAAEGWAALDGILLDLGVSSWQLDDPGKGFSYRGEGPLDLRFDQGAGRTAAELVADLPEEELAAIFWKYGEERASRRLARALVRERVLQPVATTGDLRRVVEGVVPGSLKSEPVLSRIFQALRIAVNDELSVLGETLDKLPGLLAPGGRIVVIAYHSLEDRLVKRFIERERRDCLCPPEIPACVCGHERTLEPLTRKAVQAGRDEAAGNRRARSARLRAAVRI